MDESVSRAGNAPRGGHEKFGGIIRIQRREKNFAQIDNATLRDDRLSWKARGLLGYLLSHDPGWIVRMGDLLRAAPDGLRSLRSGMKELERFGYVLREKSFRANGQIRWITVIFERPELAAKRIAQEPQNYVTPRRLTSLSLDPPPARFVPMENVPMEPSPPSAHFAPMDNAPVQNASAQNVPLKNTDEKNTNSRIQRARKKVAAARVNPLSDDAATALTAAARGLTDDQVTSLHRLCATDVAFGPGDARRQILGRPQIDSAHWKRVVEKWLSKPKPRTRALLLRIADDGDCWERQPMLLPAAAPDEFDPFRAERGGKDPDRRPPQQRVRDALQAGRVTHVHLHGSEELTPLAGARWSNASLTLVIGRVHNRSDGTVKGRHIDAAADGASGWLRALSIPAQEIRLHRFFCDGLPARGGANAFVEELDERLMSLIRAEAADRNVENESIPAAGLEDRLRCDPAVYKLAIEEMRKTGQVRIGDNAVHIQRPYGGRARCE